MKRAAIVLAVLISAATLLAAAPADADGSGTDVLIDYGNGVTVWLDCPSGPTYLDAASAALDSADVAYTSDGGWFTSIGGMSDRSVGAQECSWRLYVWDGVVWTGSGDYGSPCDGAFAVAFYPEGPVTPAETPDERAAWTSHRGDSAQSGVSDSHGPDAVATPLEWYRTYSTGYVDSSVVSAGGLLYHTTGGTYGGSGSDRYPWVYCLDRYTGEEVWSYMMQIGAGYEVTSPLIAGDMLVVTATSGDVYLFDRLTGDVLDRLTLELSYPMDGDGDIVWEGRTFYTGATTPVYDSGAVYFATSDGRVMAYGIVAAEDGGACLSPLWEHVPPSDVVDGEYTGTRGCFYYHAPVVADVDGTRMLFVGSYEGYIHALDASTGEEVWTQRAVDLREDNPGEHRGTPGSVAGIAVTEDGRLIVTCTDGSMGPVYGTLSCIDAATGTETYWSYTVLSTDVTLDGNGFYACLTPSYGGDTVMPSADGTVEIVPGLYRIGYDGSVEWCTPFSQTVKAGITLADGRLYVVDYSAGTYYPNGGGVTAYSAEDGSEVWKVRLEPYSDSSFNMVAATVIDGRVYVANDYGAVYCLSEVQGRAWGDDGEIVLDTPGFGDWSWAALAAVFLLAVVMLYRYY